MEKIIVYLKKLGFTEYEAKVYLALLSKHPATAYTISKASGVPHSRVYDIARRLIKKGLQFYTERIRMHFHRYPRKNLSRNLKKVRIVTLMN